MFSVGGWIDERYEDDGLNAALDRYLGDAWLSDALVDVFVTAYDIHDRFAFFFRSARARTDPDVRLPARRRPPARRPAAPSYFEPVEVTDRAGARTYPLIDGGVYAVNPSMCAYADVARSGRLDELELMLSLGTGAQTRAYTLRAGPLVGPARVGAAGARHRLRRRGGHDRVRGRDAAGRSLRPPAAQLEHASDDLDDASAANLAALRADAEALIAASDAELDRVCAVLAG